VQEPLVGDMKDFKTMKLPSSAAFWVGGGGGGEAEGWRRGGGGCPLPRIRARSVTVCSRRLFLRLLRDVLVTGCSWNVEMIPFFSLDIRLI